MHRLSTVVIALSTAGIFATSAAGQRTDGRRGFWVAGAAGGSSVDIDCIQYCPSDRKLGISGSVQLGGTLSTKSLAGIEANGWRTSASGEAREFIAVLGVFHYYPVPEYALNVKFGLGAGRYGEEMGDDQMSATGFVVQLGLGYEFAVTRHLWTGPFVQYMNAPDMNASRNRFSLSTDFRVNLFQLGGRIAWH